MLMRSNTSLVVALFVSAIAAAVLDTTRGSFRVGSDIRRRNAIQLPVVFFPNLDPLYGDGRQFIAVGRSAQFTMRRGGIDFHITARSTDREMASLHQSTGAPSDTSHVHSPVESLSLEFQDSQVKPTGEVKASTSYSVLTGSKCQWIRNKHPFQEVRYTGAWPGVDIRCNGTRGGLKYEFMVMPNFDPGSIRLAYRGLDDITIDGNGQMVIRFGASTLIDECPTAYQQVGGKNVPVAVRYAINSTELVNPYPTNVAIGRTVKFHFALGAYDRRRPLIIDPAVLVYCGLISGSGFDNAYAAAVDSRGALYVAGYTQSGTLPASTNHPVRRPHTFGDAFVAKVNPQGTKLEYVTFIGGSERDAAFGIAVDPKFAVYIVGQTYSSEQTFPVKVGPSLHQSGSSDAWIAKLSPSGNNLEYCGYIGGSGYDYASGVAVDDSGDAYITGMTTSSDGSFPIVSAPQPRYGGGDSDAFVARIARDGRRLTYCSFVGGKGGEVANGVQVDAKGCAYITGTTDSNESSFPVTVGPSLVYRGNLDGFVAKINSTGTQLVYCGYIGGTGADKANGIALDDRGCAYVVGTTGSTEHSFPVRRGPSLILHHAEDDTSSSILSGDAFVAKVAVDGSRLEYCGYIGGDNTDFGNCIAVDSSHHAYVGGRTVSSAAQGFPVRGGPNTNYQLDDAFVAAVAPDGSSLEYCGYIGGTGSEQVTGIAVDDAGRVFLAGSIRGPRPDFPLRIGPGLAYKGDADDDDAFVAMVARQSDSTTGGFRSTAPKLADFGTVKIGKMKVLQFRIENQADTTLRVNVPRGSGEFSVSPSGFSSINARDGITITVAFRPVYRGEAISVLVVTSSDPATPLEQISLQGIGA